VLRLGLAAWLFAVVVALLYLIGMAQNFSEETQASLFTALRWISWAGLVFSLALAPWALVAGGRRVMLFLGVGFLILVLAVAAWGAWLYPQEGAWPW